MILDLSSVLSEQHKPIEASVSIEMESFSYGGVDFPVNEM